MTKSKDNTKIVEEAVTKIFSMLGINPDFKIVNDKKNESIDINIDAKEEAGLLIGKRGETLNSLQYILTLIVMRKVGDWQRVVVNIGDWREKQEEYLKNLALQAADRARVTGEVQNLYNLNPSQRRIVHMVLSEEKDIKTESEGEGIERYLVVRPLVK